MADVIQVNKTSLIPVRDNMKKEHTFEREKNLNRRQDLLSWKSNKWNPSEQPES